MNRTIALLLPVAALLSLPACSTTDGGSRYAWNGQTYGSRQQCLAAKRNSEKRGTVAGAVAAGAGAALLGANLGEAALIAGGGAVVGNQLAARTKRC